MGKSKFYFYTAYVFKFYDAITPDQYLTNLLDVEIIANSTGDAVKKAHEYNDSLPEEHKRKAVRLVKIIENFR